MEALKRMNRLPISVCMVSAAEAHRIGKALASIAEWTSEIVVVLNEEVKDETEEIAKSHGAKISREPWKGMIGQKASAAAKAGQEWILDLDADEVVSDELRDEIERALSQKSENGEIAAFSYPRLSWYCGRWIRHGDWYPDRQNRLWRRGRANWGGVEPHAKLLVDGPVKQLRGNLLHYSNDSINRQIEKIIPFSDAFMRQHLAGHGGSGIFDLGIRPFWRFLRAYIFRAGFLDGWPGYYIAWLNAFSAVTRYAKIRENQLNRKRDEKERIART
jgi:glycosyltransferase involved in cell wall biosynthesis